MNRDELVMIIGPAEAERLDGEDCDIRNCAIAPGGVEWVAQIRVNIDGDAFIAEAVYRPSEDEQIRLGNQESIEWEVDHYELAYQTPKKAFWFSRHAPTEAQIHDLGSLGYELVVNQASYDLGNTQLRSRADVASVIGGILSECRACGAYVCAGVFPVPIAEAAMDTADASIAAGDYLPGTVTLWSSWNNTRSEEGQAPTFTHLKFCRVGLLHNGARFLYS